MRILFINTLYEPFIGGGAEIILKDLVEGAYNFGHKVKVLAFWDKEDKEDIVNGIPVYRAKIPNLYLPYGKVRPPLLKRRLWHLLDIYNPKSKKIVLDQIKQFKPDIISIHNTPGWSSAIWDAVDEAKVPAIQVLHDLYLLCPRHMFRNNSICKKQCLSCKLMRLPYKSNSNKVKAVVGVGADFLGTPQNPITMGDLLQDVATDTFGKPYSDLESYEKDVIRVVIESKVTPFQEEERKKAREEKAS